MSVTNCKICASSCLVMVIFSVSEHLQACWDLTITSTVQQTPQFLPRFWLKIVFKSFGDFNA